VRHPLGEHVKVGEIDLVDSGHGRPPDLLVEHLLSSMEDIFLGRRLQGTLARVSRPSDQDPLPPGEVDSAVDRLSQRSDDAEPTTAGILVWAYIAGRQLDAWLADALADTGLSTSDYGALAAVAFAGDRSMTAGDLARWVVQTSGGTTKTLQRLVDRGLVRRVSDTDDGRRTIVQPTAAGARRASSVAASLVERLDQDLDGLDAESRDRLLAALRDLSANLTGGDPQDPQTVG
jgi:DNA-binding MarR family transcriptional regulator